MSAAYESATCPIQVNPLPSTCKENLQRTDTFLNTSGTEGFQSRAWLLSSLFSHRNCDLQHAPRILRASRCETEMEGNLKFLEDKHLPKGPCFLWKKVLEATDRHTYLTSVCWYFIPGFKQLQSSHKEACAKHIKLFIFPKQHCVTTIYTAFLYFI